MARIPKHLPYLRPKSGKVPNFRMFELPGSPALLEWMIKEFSIFKKINDVKGIVNGLTTLLVLSIMMKNYVASSKKH